MTDTLHTHLEHGFHRGCLACRQVASVFACGCAIEDGIVVRTDDGCPTHSKRPELVAARR